MCPDVDRCVPDTFSMSIFRHALAAAVLLHASGATAQSSDLDQFIDGETVELAESYDKRLRYTPSTVVILDREYINNSGALTVAELLERVVGIHMTRKAYGASSNQYIRGLDSNLLILHNGVENAKLIPELLAIPVIDLERVEVVKGSHYPLYGASAVVGTVNLVTSRVQRDTTRFGLRGGTEDTEQVWATRSDVIGPIGYSAYFSRTNTDTTSGTIRTDLQRQLDQVFGSDASLAPRDGFFGAEITDARLTLELGDRWTLHQFVNQREFGAGVGLGQSLDPTGQENVTYYSADLRYERPLGVGDVEARLTYNYVDLEYEDLFIFPPGAFGGALPEGAVQRSFSQRGDDVFGEGLYRIVIGRNTLDLGIGGGLWQLDTESDIRNYRLAPEQPALVPVGEFVDFSDTSPLFGEGESTETAHVMVRNEYEILRGLFLNAGGRVDYSSAIGTFLIPRAGIHWVAGQYTNVGLLYGESVQTPSQVVRNSQGGYFAQGDADLAPEKLRLLELSVDHRFGSAVSVNASAYTYHLDDTIAIVSDPEALNGNSFVNLSDDERGTGVELVVGWDANESTRLTVGLSAVDVESDDRSIATSPRLEPYLELNYAPSPRFNANVAVIGVAERDRREGDEREPIHDYVITNATLTTSDSFIGGLDFSLSVQNLFDVDAREDISTNIPFDLPVYPQRVLAGVTYRLD